MRDLKRAERWPDTGYTFWKVRIALNMFNVKLYTRAEETRNKKSILFMFNVGSLAANFLLKSPLPRLA